MLNKQIVMGRLSADPELKMTPNRTPVCSFTIASDEDIKKQDGTRDTDWVNCIAWGPTAEAVCKYMKKGRLILLEGRPKTRSYKDKNGVTRSITELRVSNVYFADNKKEEPAAEPKANAQKSGGNQYERAAANSYAYDDFFNDIGDAELPF